MIDTVDKSSQVRERIRWELRRLYKKEKALNRKKEELETYVTYLEKLLQEVKQVKSVDHLEEIINRGELKTRIRPDFFKMSRYFAEKELVQKLEKEKKEREKTLREIRTIQREKKDANLCPNCYGQGQLRETHYVREDAIVRPMLRVTTCPLCEGKGRIDF
jgi:Asp-tRNA(Asn)/Glu-tRNA(Gln) amidotransferase C subunit